MRLIQIGARDREGDLSNGIKYPAETTERAHLSSVIIDQDWTKWASLPPIGTPGNGSCGSGKGVETIVSGLERPLSEREKGPSQGLSSDQKTLLEFASGFGVSLDALN